MPKKLQEAFASNQEITKWPKELKQWRRKQKKSKNKEYKLKSAIELVWVTTTSAPSLL